MTFLCNSFKLECLATDGISTVMEQVYLECWTGLPADWGTQSWQNSDRDTERGGGGGGGWGRVLSWRRSSTGASSSSISRIKDGEEESKSANYSYLVCKLVPRLFLGFSSRTDSSLPLVLILSLFFPVIYRTYLLLLYFLDSNLRKEPLLIWSNHYC